MEDLTVRSNGRHSGLTPTLREVVAPVFRQRRLAALIFVGIFFGAVLCALVLPRKYEAEMKIFVNRERVDPVVTPNPDTTAGATPVTVVSEEELNSEVELLKSRDLLEKVVLSCGLTGQKDSVWGRMTDRAANAFRGAASSPEATLARSVQDLEERLVVDPLKKTMLIRIAYTAHDPALAAHVLQTLGTLYQEKHASVHRPAGTFSFFDHETERYRDELATAEAQLTNFDGQGGVVAPAAQKQLVLQQLSVFEAELQQAQANSSEAIQRVAALKAQAATTPERQTTSMKKTDDWQLLAQLESTLLSLELKRTEMLEKYAPTYPPVRQVETQIVQARAAIARAHESPTQEITTDRSPAQDWLATEIAKAETDHAAFAAQAAATARVVRHYQEFAQTLAKKGVMEDDLVRNVKTAEDNYLLYLRKREEARISDALDSKRIVNVSIAEAATVPALPTLNLVWLLIGGFFSAGIVGVGSAYAADRLDSSFRTPDELGSYLDVTVLASIPKSNTK